MYAENVYQGMAQVPSANLGVCHAPLDHAESRQNYPYKHTEKLIEAI